MEKLLKNGKITVIAIFVLGIAITTIIGTFAWFSYSRNGVKENTITSGTIKFHYNEDNQGLILNDAMPMTDLEGKRQNTYFDFTITADTSRAADIPYYITVRRTSSSFADMDNVVRVFLSKVDSNGEEKPVSLTTGNEIQKFVDLDSYTNSEINIPATEKALYADTVLAGTKGYTQKYRLRMWVDYDANYLVQNNGVDTYPLQGKIYGLTVNVYGVGNAISEETKVERENVDIESMSIGSNEITTTDGENYSTTIEVASTDDIPTSITVETEGAGATVTATKVNTTGALIEESKIKRLSSTVNVQLPDLTLGTNNYIITVTSFDKTKTETYNLAVTVELKQPESFAKDDWSTIVNAIRNNNTSMYHVGDTKVISLDGFGDHTVRIANITSCEDALIENPNLTSETACGFVVEFADIISKQKMHSAASNVGGYPGTNVMYNYVTNTVYNALPSQLKAVMLDTTIVSSHGNGSDATCNTALETRDAKCNYVTKNQKIYLLDEQEVYGNNDSKVNTAYNTTRRLDYYSNGSSWVKKYNNEATRWWLRTARGIINTHYELVRSDFNYTSSEYNSASGSEGVSPAFRIG